MKRSATVNFSGFGHLFTAKEQISVKYDKTCQYL